MRPRLILVAALAACLALVACGPNDQTSVEGGGCKLTPPPGRTVCGQTAEDQDWIDTVITRNGAACHWEKHPDRPCMRIVIDPADLTPEQKAQLDQVLHPKRPKQKPTPKPAPKKRSIVDRVLHRAPKDQ